VRRYAHARGTPRSAEALLSALGHIEKHIRAGTGTTDPQPIEAELDREPELGFAEIELTRPPQPCRFRVPWIPPRGFLLR
jgi:hypothetical protein